MLALPSLHTDEQQLPKALQAQMADQPLWRRVLLIRAWLTQQSRAKPKYMVYLMMYDITNNKVRTQIAKYLIKKGCIRLQKSVYMYKGTRKSMSHIAQTLREVNAAYDNQDSIIVLPAPQDKLTHMKIIGRNVNFSAIVESRNVLVF